MKQFPLSAHLLKTARKKSGLKQAEFISKHKLGITQATYSRYEQGKIQIPFAMLLKLGLVQPIEVAE